MKKQFITLLLLLLCMSTIHASDSDILEKVEHSARSWLELVDNEEYVESWHQLSVELREKMSESDWIKSITTTRAPLGSADNRYIATAGQTNSLSGLPDGEYIILQFYTMFANKGLGMETIALAKQQNGAWLVAEYTVK
ncbi:MAG: DUF4019 domain-containing protein [Betaproteobacteria bacterium]|nr:DUF4019 domain-containing protein [Betaproteobacteria bacterium]